MRILEFKFFTKAGAFTKKVKETDEMDPESLGEFAKDIIDQINETGYVIVPESDCFVFLSADKIYFTELRFLREREAD